VCFVITKESELHHSIGSLIDGAHPGPKTDRDYLGRYCHYYTALVLDDEWQKTLSIVRYALTLRCYFVIAH